MRTTLVSRIIIFGVIAFALTCILLSSCITQKRCNERFPPTASDSTRTWVEYHCDSFAYPVPYQELTFDTSGVIPENITLHKTVKKDHLTGTIDVKDRKLTFKCAEDSLKFIIERKDERIHTLEVRKVMPKEVPVRDGWYYFYKGWFWVTVSIIIGAIGFAISKIFAIAKNK